MSAAIIEELRAKNEHLKKALSEAKFLYKNQTLTYQTEIKGYQKENNCLKEDLAKYQEKCQRHEEEYENLIQAIKNANRERYGSKSERFVDAEQQRLFELDKKEEAAKEKAEDIEKITYTRKKKGSKKPDRDSIPTREVIIEAKERVCGCCGKEKHLISYKTKEKLHYQPAKLELIIEKREVLGCSKGCDKSMTTAEGPKQLLPKVKATEELLSYITISKVLDRQPLYHLEKKLDQRYYWHIPRHTMARWLIQLSWGLQPLINLMKDEVIGYDIASADATSLQVLKEPGRPAQRKSYAYCIRGGPPGKEVVLFEYNALEHKEYIKDSLLGFKGRIHVDADAVFMALTEGGDVKLCYCHSHSRRKFEQIAKTAKKAGLAKEALKMYQTIYKIERYAKDEKMNAEERYELRKEKTEPLLVELKAWLDENKEKVPPKSPIGKAISYCLNNWPGFLEFLNDGRLEIDNNLTEQKIKPFVIGRKNFLFADTVPGADALGAHFGLILSAIQHGLNPYDYYVAVLKRAPYCKNYEDWAKLLPWNINKSLLNS